MSTKLYKILLWRWSTKELVHPDLLNIVSELYRSITVKETELEIRTLSNLSLRELNEKCTKECVIEYKLCIDSSKLLSVIFSTESMGLRNLLKKKLKQTKKYEYVASQHKDTNDKRYNCGCIIIHHSLEIV